MSEQADEPVEKLILEVMKVQRRYSHELRNVKVERQEKVKEAIERLSKGNS
jgi:hypothetical protein